MSAAKGTQSDPTPMPGLADGIPAPETPGLVASDPDSGEPRLVAGYSPTSGRYHFPLADVCPYSGADDIERRLLSSEGTLWAWTTVTAPPPGYAGPLPYDFGVVELPEGLRIITRLECTDPAALREGATMRLVTDDIPVLPPGEGGSTGPWVHVHAFTPSDPGAPGDTEGPSAPERR